jgi:hypothetical protein
MNTRTHWIPLLSLTAVVGLGASQASAGSCQSEIRNIPATGDDQVFMTCKLNTGRTVDGNNLGGNSGAQKRIAANLNGPGSPVATEFTKAEGMNAAGVVLSGCAIEDHTPNAIGQQITGGVCAAAVKWRSSIFFTG